MHLIQLTHFFFLVFSSDFLAPTFDVFNVSSWLCFLIPLVSHLISMLLLGHILLCLVFVQPWNLLDVNLALFE